MVLAQAGYAGTNDAAKSFASLRPSRFRAGNRRHRVPPAAIAAAMSAWCPASMRRAIQIISGNHGRQVGEAVYPRSRVIVTSQPSDRRPVSESRRPSVFTTRQRTATACRGTHHRFTDHRIAGGNRGRAKPVPRAPGRYGRPNRRRPSCAQPPPHLAVQPMPELQAPHLTVQQCRSGCHKPAAMVATAFAALYAAYSRRRSIVTSPAPTPR